MNHPKNNTLDLRIANIYMVLVSMLLFVAALFMTAILPSLLIRYLYAGGQNLLTEPKLLEYIPLVSFSIATVYFVYVVVAITLNEMKIKRMVANGESHRNMEVDTELTESELMELEAIVDEAIAEKAKPRKKSATRKKTTSKKTTARKTTTQRKTRKTKKA